MSSPKGPGRTPGGIAGRVDQSAKAECSGQREAAAVAGRGRCPWAGSPALDSQEGTALALAEGTGLVLPEGTAPGGTVLVLFE